MRRQFLIFLLFLSTNAVAQSRFKASHPISADALAAEFSSLRPRGVGTFRVLAVMVEFQEDNDARTTGTGRFNGLPFLQAAGDTIIDPLPHDRAYFQRKLDFLKNYFETNSDGKARITYTVPNRVYQLSRVMSEYAPPRTGTDFTRLAQMAQEVWQLVNTQSPELDFTQFDCFIIFHAGVGRDIDLVALGGTNPTPFDLPSITFNLNSLRRFLGASFNGFQMRGGARITNTLILPSTQSREIDALGGKTLLELSTNGLLCASFESFLGVPDLFNTANGRSGIGRFGLLDGEGIFNYNGILPPEPSAWERVYLGWATPITVSSIDQALRLPAQGVHQNSDSVIYRIPITSSEYLLLENRNRNARGRGVTLTRFFRGTLSTQTFTDDQADFSFSNTSGLNGQIVASDNYDWSLPTAVANNRRFDGGVLVWHIDDDLIQSRLDSNRVNTDSPRGVYLLEADGSQDIGQNYGIQDAGNGTQSGVVFDAFFQGNIAPPYRNFIDDNTFPNTRSNRGAMSKIRLSDFSTPAPVMTARFQRGDDMLRALPGFPTSLSFSAASATFGLSSGISFQPIGSVGTLAVNSQQNAAFQVGVPNDRATMVIDSRYKPILTSLPNIGSIFIVVQNRDSVASYINSSQPTFVRELPAPISAAPVFVPAARTLLVGGINGQVFRLLLDSLRVLVAEQVSGRPLVTLSENLFVAEDRARWLTFPSPVEWNFDGRTAVTAAASGRADGFVGAVVTKERDLLLLNFNRATLSQTITVVPIPCINDITSSPAIADLEHRGELCTIVTADDKIFAYNTNGTLVSNFPITLNSAKPIHASPIVADVDGDTFEDVIVQTQDGRLLAYNRFGKNLFTLPIAENTETTPTVVPAPSGRGLYLFSVDRSGLLQGFTLPNASQNIAWSSLYADNLNGNTYRPLQTSDRVRPVINEFMPERSVFNYPNPASSETRFRFFLSEAARVTIHVFDLTGNRVWEQTTEGQGGTDNEVVWNLNGVQSGVYYGTVTASGRETKTVRLKIAVVK